MNNKSPRNISILLALVLATFITLFSGFYNYFSDTFNITYSMLLFLITGALSFLMFITTLEKFIHSRIRLIYKTIHNLKTQKGQQLTLKMSDDILKQVNREVLDWADSKKNEIQKLKDKESFRKEFIGNLSHELKTPVFAIQGYLLTLLEGGLEDPKISTTFLQRAAKSVDRMVNLLEDLDSIAQLETGGITFQFEKFDIVANAQTVMDSLEISARKRKITLKFNQKYDRAIHVIGDANKIQQVLTNLIVNSINYGREGGETEIRFFDMDENYLVEVADNGIGMSEKSLPRIFERFYRIDRSRSRNVGGSGLGLAICKHILEVHNQTLSVRSTEDIGTTFSFTLEKSKG